MGKEAKYLYQNLLKKFANDMRKWLQLEDTYKIPYKNEVTEKSWTENKRGNSFTMHPTNGKRITCFYKKTEDQWYFVHNNEFSEKPGFVTRRQAEKAAEKKFGKLEPTNIQTRKQIENAIQEAVGKRKEK